MFDIGFWEIALVGVVALLVLGPERLPKVARVAGMWVGKGRRFMSSVKGEIDRELKADELKSIMAKQANASDLFEITEQAREGLSQASSALSQPVTDSSASKPAASASAAKSASKPASKSASKSTPVRARKRATSAPSKAKSNQASKDKADESD